MKFPHRRHCKDCNKGGVEEGVPGAQNPKNDFNADDNKGFDFLGSKFAKLGGKIVCIGKGGFGKLFGLERKANGKAAHENGKNHNGEAHSHPVKEADIYAFVFKQIDGDDVCRGARRSGKAACAAGKGNAYHKAFAKARAFVVAVHFKNFYRKGRNKCAGRHVGHNRTEQRRGEHDSENEQAGVALRQAKEECADTVGNCGFRKGGVDGVGGEYEEERRSCEGAVSIGNLIYTE